MIKCTWSGENSFISGNPWQLSCNGPNYEAVHWYCGVWFVRGISNSQPHEKRVLYGLFRGAVKRQKKRSVNTDSTLAWAFTEPLAGYKIVRSGKYYYLRVFSNNGKESYFIKSPAYEVVNEALFAVTGKRVREEVLRIMGGSIFLSYDGDAVGDYTYATDKLSGISSELVELCHHLIESGGSYGLMLASKLFEAVGSVNDVVELARDTPSIE